MTADVNKKIVLRYWKDRVTHRFRMGRNASLHNVRSWTLVAGKRFLTFELHGWGTTT